MKPVIFGLSGPEPTADERAFFAEAEPAGFILFRRNIVDPAQLRALTDDLRALHGRDDLLIMIDQEGGRVARMQPPHWPAFPPMQIFDRLYDIAPSSAIAAARANAAALGLADRADMRRGDWADGVAERFDLILANPPYIVAGATLARDVVDHEPHGALFAGADGLDDYRRIAPALPRLLTPGGMAAIEIGYDQSDSVSTLLAEQGLSVDRRRDLGGYVRCLIARLPVDPA